MTGSDWIAIGALGLAALSIAKDFVLENKKAKREFELKKYEVTFLQKRQSFADLFSAFQKMFQVASIHGAYSEVDTAYVAEVNALHGLMPFLPKSDHAWLAEQATEIERFTHLIWFIAKPEDAKEAQAHHKDFMKQVATLRTELFAKLFPD